MAASVPAQPSEPTPLEAEVSAFYALKGINPSTVPPADRALAFYVAAAEVGLPLELISGTYLLDAVPGIGKARLLEIREKVRAMGVVPGVPATHSPREEPRAVNGLEERLVQAVESLATASGDLREGMGALTAEIKVQNETARKAGEAFREAVGDGKQGEPIGESQGVGKGPYALIGGVVVAMAGGTVAWLPFGTEYAGVLLAVLGGALTLRSVFRRRNATVRAARDAPEEEMPVR
ncbi:MAG: hypothetical protein KGI26_04865 [Thaumarchaeota archaeon]|nr:hypothetical protein [Nitrososphaerota archaeon]